MTKPHYAPLALLALLTLAGAAPVRSAGSSSDLGGVESPFDLGYSARSLAMGGAMGALADDAGAALSNPGALAALPRQELATMHTSLFLDTLYDAVAYARPDGRGTALAAVFRLATTGVPRTTTSIQSEGVFTVEQIQGVLAYGLPVWKSFSAGAAVKYLRQSVPPVSDSGFGADVGILFRPVVQGKDRSRFTWKNVTAGFAVANLVQSEVRLRQDVSRPEREYRLSVGYHYLSPGNNSTLALGVELRRSSDILAPSAGVEYGFRRLLFLRGGYDGVAPTVGAGLQYKGFELDWALAQRDLGASHRFSLVYRFGEVKDPRVAQRLAALKWIAHTYGEMGRYPEALKAWNDVREEFPDQTDADSEMKTLKKRLDEEVGTNLKEAQGRLDAGDMARAIPPLTRALALDPENALAKELLRKADEKAFFDQNYLIGLEAFNESNYKAAVDAFEVIYRRNPRYRDVARLWSDAKSHYEPLGEMPEELSQLYGKGVSLYLAGRYDRAIEVWQKVLARSTQNFLVQRNIAEAQARMKEAEENRNGVKP